MDNDIEQIITGPADKCCSTCEIFLTLLFICSTTFTLYLIWTVRSPLYLLYLLSMDSITSFLLHFLSMESCLLCLPHSPYVTLSTCNFIYPAFSVCCRLWLRRGSMWEGSFILPLLLTGNMLVLFSLPAHKEVNCLSYCISPCLPLLT